MSNSLECRPVDRKFLAAFAAFIASYVTLLVVDVHADHRDDPVRT